MGLLPLLPLDYRWLCLPPFFSLGVFSCAFPLFVMNSPSFFPPFLYLQIAGGEEAIPGLETMTAERRDVQEFTHMFDNCVFFLAREVPRYSLEPVIRAFGGTVSWEGVGDEGAGPFPASDPRITHHVVDRPKLPGAVLEGRHYIQPQWVYDSINARTVRKGEGGERGEDTRAERDGMFALPTHVCLAVSNT